jgi:hypothetical protein
MNQHIMVLFLFYPLFIAGIGLLITILLASKLSGLKRWLALFFIPGITLVTIFMAVYVVNLFYNAEAGFMITGVVLFGICGAIGFYYAVISIIAFIKYFQSYGLTLQAGETKSKLKTIIIFITLLAVAIFALYISLLIFKVFYDFKKEQGKHIYSQPSPVDLENTRKRAGIVNPIKEKMIYLSQAARDCRNFNNGEILSGSGGDIFCSTWNKNASGAKWPSLTDVCGPNPADTKWSVVDGGNNAWKLSLTCANFPGCSGPANAVCNTGGCEFKGGCEL